VCTTCALGNQEKSIDGKFRAVGPRDGADVGLDAIELIRAGYWEERVPMIQWWADYLDELRATGNVVSIEMRRRETA
jgi:hypothetical protein